MTQDDRWLSMWQKYMNFLHRNKRRPSKYRKTEMKLVNWAKNNRKLRNKGVFPEHRMEKYKELLAESEKYQRVNQHAYINGEKTDRK